MPWRFLVFLVIFGIFLAFITFNLENKCDISFGFTVIHGVPVFLTVFISFVFGLFCSMPFIFRAGIRRKDTAAKENKDSANKDNNFKNNMKERRLIFQKKHGYSNSEGEPHDADK